MKSSGTTFQNNVGIATQVLLDLQKLYCCVELHKTQTNRKTPSNALRTIFKDAASATGFSSRLTLAFRNCIVLKFLGAVLIIVKLCQVRVQTSRQMNHYFSFCFMFRDTTARTTTII